MQNAQCVKPVLNWANKQFVQRTTVRFLTGLLVRRTWFGQFDELHFVLNWLIMRCKLRPELAAEAQQTAWSKMWAQVMLVYFNHPSQGNSTNYCIIFGPRDKAVPPTSQQIKGIPRKRVKYLATPSSTFPFLSSSSTGEFSALSQSEARFAKLGEYSRTCLARVFGPWT